MAGGQCTRFVHNPRCMNAPLVAQHARAPGLVVGDPVRDTIAEAVDDSGVIFRMSMRGSEDAMPPLGTEQIDDDGIDLIREWIDTL